MRCPLETQEGMAALLSHACGRADADGAGLLGEHVKECPACREYVARQSAVWEVLDGWDAAPVSPDFDRRLYRRIESEGTWWERLVRRLTPAVLRPGLPAVAAASLMIAAGVLLHRPATAPPAPRSEAVRVEKLEPALVERALDDVEMLSRFDHTLRAGEADPKI